MARKMQALSLTDLIAHYEKLGYNVIRNHSLDSGIQVVWLKKVIKINVRKLNKGGHYIREVREVPRFIVLHKLENGEINVYKPRAR